jgi:propionyl-CoA synthetase
MLACPRVGAIHSVVFGGFGANELAARIEDSGAKLVVCGSCGIGPGSVMAYKPLVDRARELVARRAAPVCRAPTARRPRLAAQCLDAA